jgi:hypothetical protein
MPNQRDVENAYKYGLAMGGVIGFWIGVAGGGYLVWLILRHPY